MDALWRALAFFRPDWLRVLAALGLLIVNCGLALLKPWPLAWIVDRLSNPEAVAATTSPLIPYVLKLAGLLALIYAAHAVLSAVQQGVVISTGLCGLSRVRRTVFEWLLGLSLRRLQGTQAGDLIYRATWDTYSFQTLFTQGVFVFLGATVSVIAMTGVMWQLNRPLTGVALATVPVLLGVMKAFGPRLSSRAGGAQSADSGIAAMVQQTVAHLPLIQSFTRESTELSRFAEQSGTAYRARWRQHRLEVSYLAVVAIVLALGTAGIVGFGAKQVSAGALSVGELLVFLAYLAQLYEPLNQLSHVGATVSQARAGAQRVLELIGESPGVERLKSAVGGQCSVVRTQGLGIRFDHVTFGYNPSQPVLRDLSLEVNPGEVVAIIGPSGAGKTTLLQLIPRLLDPDSGSVQVGGEDVRKATLTALRRQVGVVLQEPLLLPTSIAENIGYGREGATRLEIEAAARAANADGFIRRLPAGYDTVVGDGAARLSVGEKQRLNLARAFLKDAPVLLLDEPTSALDADSEEAVLAGLRGVLPGRTVLMVAHRLATLREVQRIVVLTDGKIIETGTPAELLARQGYFSRLTRTPD
ncbi:MAG TPA: ABC transporter ATP-binding protein [Verrucomicrobiota bacterium]|nr:ABC transporter ATP-binding protein [Verrucomicrobiota bacterium]